MKIELPYKYVDRPYQEEAKDMIWDNSVSPPEMKVTRWVIIWHRRAWKDKFMFNRVLIPWALKRVWLYYYVFPEYAQGRKALWENIDNDWFKLLNHIPKELIKSVNNSEMKIELINGSIIRVVGTDKNIDWLVGSNPMWVIFSEYPLSNPIVWDLIRPMLKLNGGWAFFWYTPRGKNHWRDLYQTALKYPDNWMLSHKTAKQTFDRDWNRIVTDKMLQEELDEWMDKNLWEQEYFVSFEANLKGAVYSAQLLDTVTDNRICSVPYQEWIPVHTFRDLWVWDATSIWFAQFYGKEIRLIDHYEATGKSIGELVDLIRSKKYHYWEHWLPHDADYRVMWEIVETKKAIFTRLWLWNIKITPKIWIDDWIQATKLCFKNMWFDAEKCNNGINALKSYVYDYNDKNKTWSKEPKHDWASHTADALRYLWVAYNSLTKAKSNNKMVTPDYSRYL